MVRISTMPLEAAKHTRRIKEPGIRRSRMNIFDAYVATVLENRNEAVVFEEIEERPQAFVLSLRGALKRHGLNNAVVRKMRGVDQIRVWISDEPIQRRTGQERDGRRTSQQLQGRSRKRELVGV